MVKLERMRRCEFSALLALALLACSVAAADRVYIIGDSDTRELTYGELDTGDYRKLKRCLACAAPFRRDTIAETNERYAEGGDHDPVLTEARKNCPRKLKQKRK